MRFPTFPADRPNANVLWPHQTLTLHRYAEATREHVSTGSLHHGITLTLAPVTP